jgi:alpha-1,6-mannosyltransferase
VWWDSPAPYGPLFLLLAAAAVAVAGTSLAVAIVGFRVIALGGLLLVAIGLPAIARRAGIDPAKALWTVLACPLVFIHLVSGAHNDAVMLGLMVAALAVVASRRTPVALVAAGALLGLAGSVKATALVVVPFAVLMAVPPGTSWRDLRRPAWCVGAGAIGIMVVVSVISGRGLGWIAGLMHSGDTVAWTSPWTAIGLTVEYATGWNAIGVTRTIGLAVLAVVLVWLWLRARHRDAVVGAGLALVATVLCAPVFHPWYWTWPLAVLAASAVTGMRWVLVPAVIATVLTTPAGYNWALATRLPGSLLMTAGIVAISVVLILRARSREPRGSDTG